MSDSSRRVCCLLHSVRLLSVDRTLLVSAGLAVNILPDLYHRLHHLVSVVSDCLL